jgi:predicted deacylase
MSHPSGCRVLYDGETQKDEAQALFEKTKDMVNALGLSVLVERPASIYVKKGLHRSTSGVTLNKLRVPSCTIELGPMRAAEPRCRAAGLAALYNLLIWAGMLQDKPKAIDPSFVIHFDEPHRYLVYPSVTQTGIVDYSKNAGEPFEQGEELAVLRAMDGQVVEKIHAEMGGWVIGWFEGVAKYPGASVRSVLGGSSRWKGNVNGCGLAFPA